MDKIKSPCVGCKFAQWTLTSNGRINSNQIGKCTKVVELPALPISLVSGAFTSRDLENLKKNLSTPRTIWYTQTYASECATFEPAALK